MKKDLRVIKTQESLRKALFTLLKTKPLETITIAELCRLARINRGTFYLHYKDVHHLFKSYVEVIVEDLKLSYREPYNKTNNNIKFIKADMIRIFHHVNNYRDFYQIVFDEHIPMMYFYMLFDTVRSFMKESIDDYTFEKVSSVQMDYYISYQTNAILGMLIEWHRQDYSTPIKELNEQLLEILTFKSPFR
ncbi:TetR/AcrR family transcriptional regulator [Virgibacillus sp. LDC-1]|uniref:TetR/AcrR family transcriptional regulator n=1 Tax=Virgibacillus sp. LDC-1 TaxID=3039856 RepID=UPI0024DE4199|nr:TetR/AcrR family transcriptional regulator [Virgibacillus sp. LDC-1]